MFQAGDIVAIPLPHERTAIGHILHISSRYKNVVCFIVFGLQEDVDVDRLDQQPHSEAIFTALEAVEHYDWIVVRNQPLTSADRHLTMREIGGGVWVEDNYLGTLE